MPVFAPVTIAVLPNNCSFPEYFALTKRSLSNKEKYTREAFTSKEVQFNEHTDREQGHRRCLQHRLGQS